MYPYQKYGLVNAKNVLKSALKGGYAIPAYNFNNMEQLQAIMLACLETQSPVILQASQSAIEYADKTMVVHMVKGALEMMKRLAKEKKIKEIPVVLHLDHGNSFELCRQAIQIGFSSVMIDGSALPYAKNVALTKKVVQYAHKYGVSVEGELGALAGIEDQIKSKVSHYTDPELAADFIKKTGVDSLAISIGTSHGAYKFKPGVKPKIRLDLLKEIIKKVPDFPIVLHGASSVPSAVVKEFNQAGGAIKSAIGIDEKQLRQAARSAVCKINVDTDSRLVMTARVRKVLKDDKKVFDPRKYLGPARQALKEMYKRKNISLFGSKGKI